HANGSMDCFASLAMTARERRYSSATENQRNRCRGRAARGSRQGRQQARHQSAALGETVDLDVFVERMSVGTSNTQAVKRGDTHRARKLAVGATTRAAMRELDAQLPGFAALLFKKR